MLDSARRQPFALVALGEVKVKSVYASLFLSFLVACGGDSSEPLASEDVPQPVDAMPDIAVALDTAPSDVAVEVDSAPPSDVGAVTCPSVPVHGDIVTFTQVPRTFPPPNLVGNIGDASNPDGQWELAEVTFFQAGTFVDWVTVAFSDGGKTTGNAEFAADSVFGINMFVDMRVKVTVGENEGENGATATIEIGGPMRFDGAFLRGDFTRCGEGMAAGGQIPTEMAFDHDGTRFRVAVVLSREAIIQLLPEAQRESGAVVVTGPLTVVARFQR